ncbi:TPA: helix-turn-helix transcriptional regulator [Streptococcus suis]|nr:helix-turn-helix transcriptional regulator [Streptococcus suis]HEM5937046.1 helix-turn-helix transcriptional regulator [Streptococcus suis]HEM5941217.1 helix-turn-helix transcriptional regulator [Streptococcus suis]HEM5947501.1 helix-turn-helix transcriptional regulator [Streptococcus suis]HEM5951667.1 helix-turn-helix transcriptional regulator [Streptococcus suis]
MSTAFERIKELADKQGLSLNDLENKLSISKNSLYGIKKANPKSDRLQEIADYFHVSTDYLLGRTDNPRIASDETAIIDGQVVDLREAAAHTMLFDGRPLDEDDIDFITAVLSAHFKNKQKD